MTLSKLLREKLDANTRYRLALELGIGVSTIDRWYYNNNDKFGHIKIINAITRITGVKLKDMFYGVDDKETKITTNVKLCNK